MTRQARLAGLLLAAAGATVIALAVLGPHHAPPGTWSQARLVARARAGDVRQFELGGAGGTATDRAGRLWNVTVEGGSARLEAELKADGVAVHPRASATGVRLVGGLVVLVVTGLLAVVGFVYWVFRSESRG